MNFSSSSFIPIFHVNSHNRSSSTQNRVAEMIAKLPEEHAKHTAEKILDSAKDRESCVSLLVNLSRKFARSRSDFSEQQSILDASSRTRAASTALLAAQKAVISRPDSKADQAKYVAVAEEFSNELLLLLQTLIQVKASEGKNTREVDIWDEETDNGKNIVFDEKDKTIKAATLNQMVIRLTDPRTSDVEFRKAFISTFQSFASPDELFTKLIQRYNVPRRKFRDTDASTWKKDFVIPLQKRVQDIFNRWIDERFTDFTFASFSLIVFLGFFIFIFSPKES